MVDDWVVDAERCPDPVPDDRRLIADLRIEAGRLRSGGALKREWPRQGERSYSAWLSDELDQAMGKGYLQLSSITASLTDGWRPRPARKPPLPAPVPGLPSRAPLYRDGT